eukprot:UN27402
MTVPFVNMTIRHVLWYQGENNMKECCDPAAPGGQVHCENLHPNATTTTTTTSKINEIFPTTTEAPLTHRVRYGGPSSCGNILTHSGYACAMSTLVKSWRDWWKIPDLSWAHVTLAAATSEGHGANMGSFRWAQTSNHGVVPNTDLQNVVLAQAYDLGDPWTGYCGQDHPKHGPDKTKGCEGWDAPYSVYKTHFLWDLFIHVINLI